MNRKKVEFDAEAVHSIARQSRGSMRDGLSILDQAISYTHGKLETVSVRKMLGMLSHDFLFELLSAIVHQNAEHMLEVVSRMSEQSINYESALDDILLKLHELSLLKVAPQVVTERAENAEELKQLESALSKEEIQLYYQIGLIGKRDLPLAPDPRTGFEMVMLRMLAFHPDSVSSAPVEEHRRSLPPKLQPSGIQSSPAEKKTERSAITPESLKPVVQDTPPSSTSKDIQDSDQWLDFLESTEEIKGPILLLAQLLSFKSRSGDTIIVNAPDNMTAATKRPENQTNLEKILREKTNSSLKLIVEVGSNWQRNTSTKNGTGKQEKPVRRKAKNRAGRNSQVPYEGIWSQTRKRLIGTAVRSVEIYQYEVTE